MINRIRKLLTPLLAVAVIAISQPSIYAAELSGAESAAWNALENQIRLNVTGGDASDYIHPEIAPWGLILQFL